MRAPSWSDLTWSASPLMGRRIDAIPGFEAPPPPRWFRNDAVLLFSATYCANLRLLTAKRYVNVVESDLCGATSCTHHFRAIGVPMVATAPGGAGAILTNPGPSARMPKCGLRPLVKRERRKKIIIILPPHTSQGTPYFSFKTHICATCSLTMHDTMYIDVSLYFICAYAARWSTPSTTLTPFGHLFQNGEIQASGRGSARLRENPHNIHCTKSGTGK